jgi:hypothetical protein
MRTLLETHGPHRSSKQPRERFLHASEAQLSPSQRTPCSSTAEWNTWKGDFSEGLRLILSFTGKPLRASWTRCALRTARDDGGEKNTLDVVREHDDAFDMSSEARNVLCPEQCCCTVVVAQALSSRRSGWPWPRSEWTTSGRVCIGVCWHPS